MARSKLRRRLGPLMALAVLFVVTACGGPARSAAAGTDTSALGGGNAPSLDQLFAGLWTQPPTSSPPAAAGRSIWFVTCSSAVSACLAPAEAGKEAAEKLGMRATVVDGKYNAGGAWSAAINSAVAAQADGIVLVGMDCQSVQQPVRQAREADIDVLGVYTADCDPRLLNVDMKFSDTIASNDAWDYQIGVNSANFIIARTQGEAKVLTSYSSAEKANALMYQGFTDTLAANCPNCSVVNAIEYRSVDFVPNGPWIQAFRSQLTKFGQQANAVFLSWDVMLAELGGAQAVREAGMDDAIVFGGLGLPQTLELVRSGTVDTVTAVMSQGWVGYAAVDQMNRAFNGQPAVGQGLGFTVVDAEHNLPPSGVTYEPPIDWKAAYEKAWGLQP